MLMSNNLSKMTKDGELLNLVAFYVQNASILYQDKNSLSQITKKYIPISLTKDQVSKIKNEIDELMFMLAAVCYKGADEKTASLVTDKVEKNYFNLLPTFKYFGYGKIFFDGLFWKGDIAGIIHRWLQLSDTKSYEYLTTSFQGRVIVMRDNFEGQTLVVDTLSDGSYYVGPKANIEIAEENIKKRRALKTLQNIESGVFGAIGYGLGGDKGSDFGAMVDSVAPIAAGAITQRFKPDAPSGASGPRAAVTEPLTKNEQAQLRSSETPIKPSSPEPPSTLAAKPTGVLVTPVTPTTRATVGTTVVAAARMTGSDSKMTEAAKPVIIESKGAARQSSSLVSATARTERSLTTAIRADIGETEAYKEAVVRQGEIGLQRPFGANVGGVDFITARRNSNGQIELIATDVKTTTVGKFPTPETQLPGSWKTEIGKEIADGKLDLGNKALEGEIKSAFAEGRITMRQINVDYSMAGQGKISGF